MLNKVAAFIGQEDLIQPGDTVICGLSGGADSVALTFCLYLLQDKLGFSLEAAHFNHQLRGEESQRDQDFAADFCRQFHIPLHTAQGVVTPEKKGLEAAAREARYRFFDQLPGKIATAHTADDNAETVLMHLVRGTGLKGLGGIAPKRGRLIRPMLTVTRQEVEVFLQEYALPHVEDSSNHTDAFLRNRIRHHVMPLLARENPRLAENLSQMAMSLRDDEAFLQSQSQFDPLPGVAALQAMAPAQRSRALIHFLHQCGIPEPEDCHVALAESLVFSRKPSAQGRFPGGITIARNYDRLEVLSAGDAISDTVLPCPGEVFLPGFRVTAQPAQQIHNTKDTFTVFPQGTMVLTSRRSGDCIRLPGGSKSLKKCLIDQKIPAACRNCIPVLRDDAGILAVYSIGINQDRAIQSLPGVTIRFEKTENK